jgi:hypothetical protein
MALGLQRRVPFRGKRALCDSSDVSLEPQRQLEDSQNDIIFATSIYITVKQQLKT